MCRVVARGDMLDLYLNFPSIHSAIAPLNLAAATELHVGCFTLSAPSPAKRDAIDKTQTLAHFDLR
jgi:hypothetical protein